MTSGDELFVTIGGRDVGLTAVLQRVDAEMTKSADQAARLGQQYARLAQAQGQPTAAGQILAGTMQRAGGASEKAILGIATQQANLGNSSRNLTQTIAGLGGQFSQLGGAAGGVAGSIGNLAGSFGTLGGIGAAIGLVKVGTDLAVAGANADLVRERFDQLAVSAGTTGEALITALRAASGGEISDLNLTLAANKAQLLGVADSAEEFGVLMGIARDRAQQMGISTTQAFNDLTTGLGRGSALILDNLGIIVSVKEANEAYAASLGKTASALTEAEQKQALINQVLAQGRTSLAATGGAVDSAAGSFARAGAALENIKNNAGSGIATSLEPLARVFGDLTLGMDATSGNIASFAGSIGTLIGQFNGLTPTIGATRDVNQQFAESLLRFVDFSASGAAAADAYAAAIERGVAPAYAAQIAEQARAESLRASAAAEAAAAQVTVASTGAMIGAADGARQHALAVQQATTAQLGYADSMALGTVQANAAAQAAQLKANADQLASVGAQTHAVAQNALAQQAQIAAQALLASGGSGASAAAALAGSSSQVDVLTAAYYRLAAAQAAAGQAATKAALAKQTPRQLIGADSDVAGIRGAKRDAVVEQRTAQIKAAHDAAEAERQYQQTLGNTGPALAHANAELAQLTKGSAAYINKQNEIARLQQQADAAAKKGAGGGGGGAPRLSAQAKLQNQLLSSQEDYQAKSEDAAQQHADAVQKINQDFYTKMRAAERDFNQAQLEGRAGFYDQLGSIENQKIAQAASAQYEAASVEAGKIAQEKGADVAEKYMSAQEQIITARARRLAEIEKAEKDKDTGKADYLRGVDQEYQKAEDAKLARIKEGEGSIAAERQKQLDDEATKAADAQDKIGLSAERAADKKVTASERAGLAIDAETAKANALAATYDRVGQSGSRAGITPTAAPTTSATPTPGTTATDTTAAPSADPIAAAISSLRDAIAAVERATSAAADKVAGAVRQSANGKLAS